MQDSLRYTAAAIRISADWMSSHEINIPPAPTISKVKVVTIFHGPSFSSYSALVDIIKLTRDVVAACNATPPPHLVLHIKTLNTPIK